MTYHKEIAYDPMTHDFAMYLNQELIGYARSYIAAEIALDELIRELSLSIDTQEES